MREAPAEVSRADVSWSSVDFSVRLRKHEGVEEFEVVEPPRVPLERCFFEVLRRNGLAVLLEVGTVQEFPIGEVVLLVVVLHRDYEDSHITPPRRHRP